MVVVVVAVVVGVDVLGGVAELGLVLGPYSRWIASTSASASFTWRATCSQSQLSIVMTRTNHSSVL